VVQQQDVRCAGVQRAADADVVGAGDAQVLAGGHEVDVRDAAQHLGRGVRRAVVDQRDAHVVVVHAADGLEARERVVRAVPVDHHDADEWLHAASLPAVRSVVRADARVSRCRTWIAASANATNGVMLSMLSSGPNTAATSVATTQAARATRTARSGPGGAMRMARSAVLSESASVVLNRMKPIRPSFASIHR